eukprot:TRINITY_DN65903_c0_g1_i1.p1 TRINITY_DN65903_c0_g1~~TRINITY_DN65903_c0_g1_i1.p1  ORF type:complete len:415 (+),score=27.52 TRINITY_DN65903_c0_g1_i1:40-1284(+)
MAIEWNPNALCDGHLAGARAQWCVDNCNLSMAAAIQRVMAEFPTQFLVGGLHWNPDVVCAGSRAQDRAQWCVDNCKLSMEAAITRVMGEFPAMFADTGKLWDANIVCDWHRAEDRAQWCVKHCNLSAETARRRVISEFPQQFGLFSSASGADSVAALGRASAGALAMVDVPPADPDHLVWSDEFDYTGPPDPQKWSFDIGGHGFGNNELQYYTDSKENAWVENNTLRIRAVKEPFENRSYTSAKLFTKGFASWQYGRVEVRLKLPTARGSWPAAWMLPFNSYLGDWPKCGEIDIMEHVGMDTGNVHGTVHTDSYNHMRGTQVGRVVPLSLTEWHTYGIIWTPDGIDFVVDGKRYHHFPNDKRGDTATWPFDQPFYLILNIAVGGDWGGQKGVDADAFSGDGQTLEVSWVRVYRL